MDASSIVKLLDELDDELDELEDALAPILKTALLETASKLPLLDKAKLYVLATYAIESIIFSYLRLNGVEARQHPVFQELTRVKQYFDKIKVAETPVTEKRDNLRVDRQAAARMIRAGVTGGEKYRKQLTEAQAKERERAHIKFEELNTAIEAREASASQDHRGTFNSESETSAAAEESVATSTNIIDKKRKVDEIAAEDRPVRSEGDSFDKAPKRRSKKKAFKADHTTMKEKRKI